MVTRQLLVTFITCLLASLLSCSDEEIRDEELIDIDGNSYKTVEIGNQVWMAENLRVTTYEDGTPLNRAPDGYCDLYDFEASFYYKIPEFVFDLPESIGNTDQLSSQVSYTWAAATNNHAESESNNRIQGICPNGWHIPTREEWEELFDYIGSETSAVSLRSTDTTYWSNFNLGEVSPGIDEIGFNALPSPSINCESVSIPNQFAYWWSSTESTPGEIWAPDGVEGSVAAWTPFINSPFPEVQSLNYLKSIGHCVRCVKD